MFKKVIQKINALLTPKVREIAFKAVVTFFEAAVSYWVVTGHLTSRTALIGALGAGLSAAFNFIKHIWGVANAS